MGAQKLPPSGDEKLDLERKRRREYMRKWRSDGLRNGNPAVFRVIEQQKRAGKAKRAVPGYWTPERRDKFRAWRFKYVFGISLEQYTAMLAEQGGVCAICRRPERRLWRGQLKALVVDHDHQTGKVRGLLCDDCNLALGRFQDSADIIRRVLEYLTTPE